MAIERIRFTMRRGTASQWTTANDVLLSGEWGLETDTGKLKIGDGLTAWNGLAYYTSGGGLNTTGAGNGQVPSFNAATSTIKWVDLPLGGAQGIASADPATPLLAGTVGSLPSNPSLVRMTINGQMFYVPAYRAVRITTPVVAIPIGSSGTMTLSAVGGTTSYVWSLADGSVLPSGVTMDSSGAVTYDGTQTAVDTSVTFIATDTAGRSGAASLRVVVSNVVYATLNPSDMAAGLVLSNGNLTVTGSGTAYRTVRATLGKSTGKWYFEFSGAYASNDFLAGLCLATQSLTTYVGSAAGFGLDTGSSGKAFKIFRNGVSADVTGYGQPAVNEVVGVAVDLDTGNVWLRKSSAATWAGGGNPAAGTSPTTTIGTGYTYFPAATPYNNTHVITFNFGAAVFTIGAPSGFARGWY